MQKQRLGTDFIAEIFVRRSRTLYINICSNKRETVISQEAPSKKITDIYCGATHTSIQGDACTRGGLLRRTQELYVRIHTDDYKAVILLQDLSK
jgi:hypothetical protein